MKLASLALILLVALSGPAGAAAGSVSEADMARILTAICLPGKIEKKSCDRVRDYPNTSQECGIELSGDGGEGQFLGAGTIYLIADYTSCEPHSNNWGGSVLFEKAGETLIFLGYHPGVRLLGCLAMVRNEGGDRLICTSGAMFQGYESDMVNELVLVKSASGSIVASIQMLLSAGRSEDAVGVNAVECGKPVYFLALDSIAGGPTPGTIAFDADYADQAMIGAVCNKKGRNWKLGRWKPDDNEAYLPKTTKPKKGRFVYDVAKRELMNGGRPVAGR